MKVVEANYNFRDVLARPLLRQLSHVLDESRTIAAVEVLHDEVEVVLALEGVVELDDKVGLGLGHEDHPLRLDVRDLVLRDHVGLLEDLDRVVVARRDLLREVDGSNCALASAGARRGTK